MVEREKRAASRVRHSVPVSIRPFAGARAEADAVSRDISSRGLFFFTQTQIEEQSQIEMVLMMPPDISPIHAKWVCCHAKVVRVERDQKHGGFGVAAEIIRLQALPEL